MPLILGGGDVMAAAETGSGKTAAFALPVLQIAHEALRSRQMGGGQAGPGSGAGGAAAAVADAAATAAVPAAPACILSAEDRDDVVAIAPDGLGCQARSEAAWGGCRATLGALSGKVYYEASVSDEGLCRCAAGAGRLAAAVDCRHARCCHRLPWLPASIPYMHPPLPLAVA